MPRTEATLDQLASDFHDRLKSIKDRTPLAAAGWYPWRSLSAIQMLDRKMDLNLDALKQMIGAHPVLDAGCGDGDIAFFLSSLGARVDAIDHPSTNYNRMEGVRRLQRELGLDVQIHVADLDSRPNLPGSDYGLAILLGVLYHLKNPYLALETLAQCSRRLYMSTRIASVTPDRKLNFAAFPLAYLVDDRELNNDPTNFWIFSEAALKRVVRRSGWNIVKYFTLGKSPAYADPVTTDGDVRAFILAESRLAAPHQAFRLERGWHELEYGASRWTERRFSVTFDLARPLQPATLRLLFQLPEVLLSQRPRTSLRATLNGSALPPAIFSTPGEHEYSATLPSLPAGRIEIEFELETAVTIGADARELGVIVYFTGEPAIRLL